MKITIAAFILALMPVLVQAQTVCPISNRNCTNPSVKTHKNDSNTPDVVERAEAEESQINKALVRQKMKGLRLMSNAAQYAKGHNLEAYCTVGTRECIPSWDWDDTQPNVHPPMQVICRHWNDHPLYPISIPLNEIVLNADQDVTGCSFR